MIQRFTHDTWIQDESAAYPNGGQTRKGAALYPDGVKRTIYAGIPDTYFSIPAHGRLKGRYVAGWVGIDDKLLDCPNLIEPEPGHFLKKHPNGELHCERCQFGLMDSPTRGALIFHISNKYEQTGGEL